MSFRSPALFPFVFCKLNDARDHASAHANMAGRGRTGEEDIKLASAFYKSL